MKEGLSSPIFLKYLEIYEGNPQSRVFAPLAEHYRQVGMIEKAVEILKKGIKQHPSYVMGHLGLAFCYFDQRQFNLAYNILRPLITSTRDNLRLQRLFAKIALEIGKADEALDVFKYILFVSPRDHEAAEMVRHLEKGDLIKVLKKEEVVPFQEEASPVAAEINKMSFNLDSLFVDPADDQSVDGWRKIDLVASQKNIEVNNHSSTFHVETNAEFIQKNIKGEEKLAAPSSIPPAKLEGEVPFMTHTLVDLYCSQGHPQRAVEILEKMLELNPADEKTVQKLQEVTRLLNSDLPPHKSTFPSANLFTPMEEVSESKVYEMKDEGHQDLLNLLDQKLKKSPQAYYDEVEERMGDFLFALKKKADEINKSL